VWSGALCDNGLGLIDALQPTRAVIAAALQSTVYTRSRVSDRCDLDGCILCDSICWP